MGLFDKFFNKKPQYDSTNIKVTDLDVGFVFDYNLSTWEVTHAYEYDWGDEYFTSEFRINNGVETLYLSVDEGDDVAVSVSKKVKIRDFGNAVMEQLLRQQEPPLKLDYEGVDYFYERESPGYFNDPARDKKTWEEFIAWEFEDKSGKHLITIEQWDEKEFEASVGFIIEPYEISNILPAERN